MIIWIDAQLPPAIASWISANFEVTALALRDIGLRDATDRGIFLEAKKAAVIVMTKDKDFVQLVDTLSAPPQVIWLTCGNTSNARLREILLASLEKALSLIESGESLVEISSI